MRKAIGALALFSVATLAGGGVLLHQGPGLNASNGWYSAATGNQLYVSRAADDFTIGGAAITGLVWWGLNSSSNVHDLSNFTGFDIAIYGNAGDRPNGADVRYHATFGLGDLAIAATGGVSISGNLQYRFETAIAPLTLGPGRYWLSIGGLMATPHADTFMWSTSDEGNKASASYLHPTGVWSAINSDVSFELIPAPGAAIVLAGAALGVTVRRRRSSL